MARSITTFATRRFRASGVTLVCAVLIAVGQEKYGPPFHASWTSGVTRYFRLDPPEMPAAS